MSAYKSQYKARQRWSLCFKKSHISDGNMDDLTRQTKHSSSSCLLSCVSVVNARAPNLRSLGNETGPYLIYALEETASPIRPIRCI